MCAVQLDTRGIFNCVLKLLTHHDAFVVRRARTCDAKSGVRAYMIRYREVIFYGDHSYRKSVVEVAGAIELDGGAGELHGASDAAADVTEHVDELTVGGTGGDGQFVALEVVAVGEACGEGDSLASVFGSVAVDGDVTGESERFGRGAHCNREERFKKSRM